MPNVRKVLRDVWRLTVATLGFLLAFFLVHLPHGPEHWSADLRTSQLAERLESQHPHIAIVELTEQSLAQSNYLEPVDRETLAAVVRALNAAEVKLIGVDFIFDRHTEMKKDKDLIQAIKDSRAQIILGAIDEHSNISKERKEFQTRFLSETGRPVGHLYFGEHHNPLLISDTVVRQLADGEEFPNRQSFAELLARADGTFREPGGNYISWLGSPKDGSETFLTLSGEDVLGSGISSPLPLKKLLQGKIVLVGGNFPDRDQHLTPFSVLHGEWFPGIFVHAQALAQLTDQSRRPIYTLPWLAWLLILFAAASGGFLVGRSNRINAFRPWPEIASVTGFIIISVLTFEFGRFVFPFVSAVLGWGWGEMLAHLFFHSKEGPRHLDEANAESEED